MKVSMAYGKRTYRKKYTPKRKYGGVKKRSYARKSSYSRKPARRTVKAPRKMGMFDGYNVFNMPSSGNDMRRSLNREESKRNTIKAEKTAERNIYQKMGDEVKRRQKEASDIQKRYDETHYYDNVLNDIENYGDKILPGLGMVGKLVAGTGMQLTGKNVHEPGFDEAVKGVLPLATNFIGLPEVVSGVKALAGLGSETVNMGMNIGRAIANPRTFLRNTLGNSDTVGMLTNAGINAYKKGFRLQNWNPTLNRYVDMGLGESQKWLSNNYNTLVNKYQRGDFNSFIKRFQQPEEREMTTFFTMGGKPDPKPTAYSLFSDYNKYGKDLGKDKNRWEFENVYSKDRSDRVLLKFWDGIRLDENPVQRNTDYKLDFPWEEPDIVRKPRKSRRSMNDLSPVKDKRILGKKAREKKNKEFRMGNTHRGPRDWVDESTGRRYQYRPNEDPRKRFFDI